MLKHRRTTALSNDEGNHYFNMFDFATMMDVDVLRDNALDAPLPDSESESIFY